MAVAFAFSSAASFGTSQPRFSRRPRSMHPGCCQLPIACLEGRTSRCISLSLTEPHLPAIEARWSARCAQDDHGGVENTIAVVHQPYLSSPTVKDQLQMRRD